MVVRAALLSLFGVLVWSGLASGHGPAPSPLRVLAVSQGSADIIQTNIGLAIGAEVGYRYGCPSQWGGLETPLAVAVDRDTIIVGGATELVESRDRGCNFEPVEDPVGIDPRRLSAMVEAEGVVWGVERGADASLVFRWAGGPVELVATLPVLVDSLVVSGGRLFLSSTDGSTKVFVLNLPLTQLPLLGPEWEEFDVSGPVSALERLSLRKVQGDTVWAVATVAQGVQWWRSRDGGRAFEAVASGAVSIHGPVTLCDGVAAVVDGVLTPEPESPPQCGLEGLSGRQLNCLGERDGFVWACELRQLYGVVDDGEEGAALERIFGLEDIAGPGLECPSGEAARLSCEQDWLHFGAESGLLDPQDIFGSGVDDFEPEPVATGAGSDQVGGCSVHGPARAPAAAFLLILLGIVRLRSRRA